MSIEIENLLLIMVVVWSTGMLFRAVKLPLILGELLAGLIFGPALLGVFHETESVKILAELGIFFLMLHAGLETEPKKLLESSRLGLLIALAGIVLPFGLGAGISFLFNASLVQALFIGVAMSITAISVTAKIFKDFDYRNSEIKNLVMVAAVADDILAFILVSAILTIATAGTMTTAEVGLLFVKLIVFFFSIIFIGEKLINPVLKKFFCSSGGKAFTLTLIFGLLFGVIAEKLGIHFVIGAYMAGLFIKEELVSEKIFQKIEDRLFGLSYSFLGPIFFVSLGFAVDFAVFSEPGTLAFLILILLGALVGKVVGAGAAAYFSGKGLRSSAIIGFAMNGRGAVELILASIGLEAGIITHEIFSILVFMAFFTTFITPIALKFILPSGQKPDLIGS
ncbi:cation:proton antiporter [Patescibacteria group bacterium]|nr:cation:proton antiporter [Patescibacteria group bacterium]